MTYMRVSPCLRAEVSQNAIGRPTKVQFVKATRVTGRATTPLMDHGAN
jgi:hypothetical protein